MKVGIIQSNFLPWRGYFDFIREVDLFLLYDDIQYTTRDWRNRNRIKTSQGTTWITVPVHFNTVSQLIEQTSIVNDDQWQRKVLGKVKNSYRHTPYFQPYFNELSEQLLSPCETISELNYRLLKWICSHLEIFTPIKFTREYHATGHKTERLIELLKKVGATQYLSGPAAQAYLRSELFEKNGIELEYKKYNYQAYEQLYPPFEGAVSIIDLLFMKGPEASELFKLQTPRNS